MRVKICGIKNKKDISIAVKAGADAIGFVNVPIKTHRNLSVKKIKTLKNQTPPFVSTVLVSMPSSVEEIESMIEKTSPDIVQIHAGLSPSEVGKLSERIENKIIRKIEPSIEEAKKFEDKVDSLLIDSSDERGAGGTGKKHNWEKTSKIIKKTEKPVILAGGLSPDNVKRAIEKTSPYAVDVSSGVEKNNRKDKKLVKKFVKEAKK